MLEVPSSSEQGSSQASVTSLGCSRSVGSNCFSQMLSTGWAVDGAPSSILVSVSVGILLQKTRAALARLIRQGFITRSLVALQNHWKGWRSRLLNFQEQLPAAKFIMSKVTRDTAPCCRKPLHQEATGCRTVLPLLLSVPGNGCPEACLPPFNSVSRSRSL